MKRFITYLFLYNQGMKDKAVGFVRTDQKENCFLMEIHVQGLERYQGKAKIYLLKNTSPYTGVYLGELYVSQGNGIAKVSYCGNVEIAGIAIQVPERYYVATCWLVSPTWEFCQGRFIVAADEMKAASLETKAESDDVEMQEESPLEEVAAEKMQEEPTQEELTPEEPTQKESTQEELTEEASMPEPEPMQEEPTQEELMPGETKKRRQMEVSPMFTSGKITSFPYNQSIAKNNTPTEDVHKLSILEAVERKVREDAAVRRIELTDIRKLPSRNWYMCNNSFVIHGFFNYHYLILRKRKSDGVEKTYLGVPGIYEQPERVMAMLFGFPEFEPEQREQRGFYSEDKEWTPQEGQFGYWLSLLDM